MKTKFSLLAMPIFLGIVLTLAISACDNGGDNKDGDSSSSKKGGGASSSSQPDVDNASIEWDDFDGELIKGKFQIYGKIYTLGKDAYIVKVKFSPSGYVTYKDNIIKDPISSLKTKEFKLGGDTWVDMENTAISCGKQSVTVEACLTDDCKEPSRKSLSFDKDQSYCNSSSSETVQSSSSSKAVWKFGPSETKEVRVNRDVELGSGSFKLIGDDVMEAQPTIQITGGRVQPVIALCDDECDDVEVGKAYPAYSDSEHLGTKPPTQSSFEPVFIGSIRSEFYLVVIGSDKFLLAFEAGPSGDVSKWPKKCIVWKATESPY